MVRETPIRTVLEALAAESVSAPHQLQVLCDRRLSASLYEARRISSVVREAVSNALKHAFPPERDGQIWINLTDEKGKRTLTIRDNGVGMRDLPREATGGRALIERQAAELGGVASMQSAPFVGSVVRLTYRVRDVGPGT